MVVALVVISQFGCNNGQREMSPLDEIRHFANVTEMSMPDKANQISKIKTALMIGAGIDHLIKTYWESNDPEFKERLVFICWELTLDIGPEGKEKLRHFFLSVFEKETDLHLRNWSAAGLVRCTKPGMEDIFLKMADQSESSFWRHAVNGLLRIGSEPAINGLCSKLKKNANSKEFLDVVGSILGATSEHIPTILADEFRIVSASGGEGAALTDDIR